MEFDRIVMSIRDQKYSKSDDKVTLKEIDLEEEADAMARDKINSLNEKVRQAIADQKSERQLPPKNKREAKNIGK